MPVTQNCRQFYEKRIDRHSNNDSPHYWNNEWLKNLELPKCEKNDETYEKRCLKYSGLKCLFIRTLIRIGHVASLHLCGNLRPTVKVSNSQKPKINIRIFGHVSGLPKGKNAKVCIFHSSFYTKPQVFSQTLKGWAKQNLNFFHWLPRREQATPAGLANA